MLQTAEHHAHHPEWNDIIACHKGAGGIEVFHLLRLLRPPQGGKRPQGRTKPGVQCIRILPHRFPTFRADRTILLRYHQLATVITVKGRDLMPPPELTRDAPVADVFQPVEIRFAEMLWHKFRPAVLYGVDGRAGQRFHLYKPLFGYTGLHCGTTAVAGSHVVVVILCLHQRPFRLQILYNSLPGLIAVHPRIFLILLHDPCILCENVDYGKVVTQPHLKVVGVVCRRDFYDAGSKFHIHIIVCHQRDFPVDNGQDQCLAHQILISLIFRVHRHCRIAQQRLGTRRGKIDVSAAIRKGIAQVPEMPFLILIFHLGVRYGGETVGTPVNDALPPVDQALFVKIHKNLLHRLITSLVHCKALPFPVTGGTHLL